ncbi:cobyrinate a,c-diamide synthase [Vibrio sp. SCSIO 43136]|uniref:cobyrinate a,c-diamide synthase n=1 Tax=Vibrio sp. SCSIO 43136 TaxID=2819101 RepID=UPI002075D880|nr:cobyrinate a,c-diamide synthase [Vibrio sp. SCSIO 43136]USD66869.1 cobyrinate a,c-diamide synthase [Vibrio sp. SCSIO 43136]
MSTAYCPALVVAAPSSGSGKTTVVAALARSLVNKGLKVRVFKTGPDFIDPQFLSAASKAPVYQLDLWMCGEQECRRRLYQAAQEADLILIEGVMGMFDGQCSSAGIAAKFDLPVLAVVDAGAMAQTFGALVHGLATYRDDVDLYGVIANRVGSQGHAEMLKESILGDVEFCGWLPKNSDMTLPERHLGLVQAQELDDLEQRLDHAAETLANSTNFKLPAAKPFNSVEPLPTDSSLAGKTIAVAKDESFAFIYQANIETLESLGAKISYFSPIAGDPLPTCDGLYLPGGYPELHLEVLSGLSQLHLQIKAHIEAGKPCVAECGGMLFLGQSLMDIDGNTQPMCGALNIRGQMQSQLAALGIVEADIEGKLIRGHTFHYSVAQSEEEVIATSISQRGKQSDVVWRYKNCIASYVHWYFDQENCIALFS